MVQIKRADISDLDRIAPLFDAYRQFYEQPADLKKARQYVKDRLEREQAVVFLAMDGSDAVGFTQLYPTFCSVAAGPVWVLYDLFVAEHARRRGVAIALMNAAQSFGRDSGAHWLKLETAVTNKAGQALYEKLDWRRENEFYTYHYYLRE